MLTNDSVTGIHTIDCEYISPRTACAYLMVEGNEAAFIENNTSNAVPLLLQELKNQNISKENVKYIIVTHIHLDHAGGTSALLKECPNAMVLAHPKAAPHIIDPTRLVESASAVYGEKKFFELYGVIEKISAEKVRIMSEGEELIFGTRTLKFIFTKGHANHHFCIYDSKSNGIFTGDSFGIAYPDLQKGKYPFLFPSSSPTDFNAEEAKLSVSKILETGADKAFLTHFGVWTDMKEGAKQMLEGIQSLQFILENAVSSNIEKEEIPKWIDTQVRESMAKEIAKRNLNLSKADETLLELDVDLNAQGLAFVAERMMRKNKIK